MAESHPTQHKPVFLIMAGGSGARFWPLSRPDYPKQFLKLLGDRPLITQTIERLEGIASADEIFVCSVESQKKLLEDALPSIRQFIFEPAAKNTGPCLLLSTLELLREKPANTVMVVLPSDHYIKDAQTFREKLAALICYAEKTEGLFTFGIVPDSPHTGYGYIEAGAPSGELFEVKRFVEKPSRSVAEQLVQTGRCFWNSGIFVWQLGAAKAAFEKWMPLELGTLSKCRNKKELDQAYLALSPIPIDIAVMEKANNVFVLPLSVGWSDVGSWDALLRLQAGDSGNAVLSGRVEFIESKGCLVRASPRTRVAVVGVKDLIIVENGDTILVADRSQDQEVRRACKLFEG